MKTINQSYTEKQRARITRNLRIVTSKPIEEVLLYIRPEAKEYLTVVLASYGTNSFDGFLKLHGIDCAKQHSDKRETVYLLRRYILDALNRLADELEGVV